MRVALAATVHDTEGRLVPVIPRAAAALTAMFAGIALNITDTTAPAVVGRSQKSFAEEPQRLRETEAAVNHVYTLMTGRPWDLMFAIRRFSRRGAEEIIRSSLVDTLANDIEWPLLAGRAGLSLGYAEADGLYYRTMDEFGATADTHDGEAIEWIRRLEFAGGHAAAFRPFLAK